MGNGRVYKWSFINRASVALINFSVNIVLARMLTEADFGLLAMIAIFIAIGSDLASCGLSDGIVHKLHPTEKDYSTVFVFNGALGLFFGLIFFFGAPFVADFFEHQELKGIMRVAGVCFFFQTLSFIQETRLRKELRMDLICKVQVGATLTVSILGITAAALGWGYVALIFTQLGLGVFFFLYYLIASRWIPKVGFSVSSFKELFPYGIHLMLAYMVTIVGRNINTSVLGRFYKSPAQSGIYYQGAKLANAPFSISEASFNYPFFAVASKEDDPEKIKSLILDMLSVIMTVNGTLLIFMLIIAEPGIELLYEAKWLGAVPVFRILALAEFLFCLRAFMQTLCKIHGRTRLVRNLGFFEAGAQLLLLLIFYRYGILWIAWTQVGGVAITTCIYGAMNHGITGIPLNKMVGIIFKVLWLPVTCGLIGGAVGYFSGDVPVFLRCLFVTLSYGISMIIIGRIFKASAYTILYNKLIKRGK